MTNGVKFNSSEQTTREVITAALKSEITNAIAAVKLCLSVREVQRLKAKVRRGGLAALVHDLKGKTSNHKINGSVREKALSLVKDKYYDFKPTFAAEKLEELEGVSVNRETLRLWMIEDKLWKPRRHKKRGTYRSWRPRKDYYGEMEQFDGCYHLWLEDRYRDGEGNPNELCLLLSVDDATGKITYAVFAANEGIIAVFHFWKMYILVHGKPIIIYLDKFSTYKINHKAAEDNKELLTQFQRVCVDLGIQLINAHSPEAKGRVERMFETLQDRLVKEMRLQNITKPEEANIFLKEIFIPKFNERFSVIPAKEGDAHRERTKQDTQNLNRIFSVQSLRTINQDFTIQFKTKWYQLKEIQPTTVRPKEHVIIEEWIDGTLHFNLRGYDLPSFPLPERPLKMKTNPVILTNHKLNWKAPPNRLWKLS